MQFLENVGIITTEEKIPIPEAAFCLGFFIAKYFEAKNKTIIVAKDENTISNSVLCAIESGISFFGANVVCAMSIAAPAVSLLTKKYAAVAGVYIFFDGVKNSCNFYVFDANGCKIDDKQLKKIAEFTSKIRSRTFGSVLNEERAIEDYKQYAASVLNYDLSGLLIALDCGYGFAGQTAVPLFEKLGAKVVFDNDYLCGDLSYSDFNLQKTKRFAGGVVRRGCDIGFVYDNLCEKLVVIDEKGNIYDQNDVLLLFACFLKEQNRLTSNCVVTNSKSLIKKCEKSNICCVLCEKKNETYSKMRENNAMIGGNEYELIMKEFLPVSDAVLVSLFVAKIIKCKKMPLSKLFELTKGCI